MVFNIFSARVNCLCVSVDVVFFLKGSHEVFFLSQGILGFDGPCVHEADRGRYAAGLP